MKLLTSNEAMAWRNSKASIHASPVPGHNDVDGRDIFNTPREYGRAIVFLDSILAVAVFQQFQGAMLWITEWWALSDETATPDLFQRVRSTFGGEGSLGDFPAQLFTATEFDALYLLSLLAMLGGWDAEVRDAQGECLFKFSHGGFVELLYPDSAVRRAVLQSLSSFGFAVRDRDQH